MFRVAMTTKITTHNNYYHSLIIVIFTHTELFKTLLRNSKKNFPLKYQLDKIVNQKTISFRCIQIIVL